MTHRRMRVPLKCTDLNPELLSERETAAFLAGYEACAKLCGAVSVPERDRLAFNRLTGAEVSELDRIAARVFVEITLARLQSQRASDRALGICLEVELPPPLPPVDLEQTAYELREKLAAAGLYAPGPSHTEGAASGDV